MAGINKSNTAIESSIDAKTNKIDDLATNGLLGVHNSLAYRVHEVERHLHSNERWYGAAATPNAEIHVADRIAPSIVSFQLDAGNNAWGSWVQVLGSSDTPAESGMVYMDIHRVLFTASEKNVTYFLQLGVGPTGAEALSNGLYTEIVFQPASNQIDSGPYAIQSRRELTGTKAWARCLCPNVDTGTLNFYHAIHEYEG